MPRTARRPLIPRPHLAEGARTIGIDPSLTSTGICIVEWDGSISLRGASSRIDDDTPRDQIRRLRELSAGIVDAVEGFRPDDVVVIEGYITHLQSAKRGLIIASWYEIVRTLVDAGVQHIVVIPPTTRAKYATGGGHHQKDKVLIQAIRRYPQADVQNNDEADALFLAAIGRHLAGHTIEPQPLPATHLTVDKLFAPAA